MTQALQDPTAISAELNSLYAPIEVELAEVEEILRSELRSRHPFVDEMVRYGCLLGGKRLRPSLLLLSAKAVGEVGREHLLLAAVVEMIHTATLVHDDVLDEADQRRHLATVNARWGNESSVLLGDYLFTHAFYLASTLESTLACRLIGQATNTVCEGELRQIGNRGNFQLREQEYLDIIAAKTAALCSCSTRLGAHFAGAGPNLVESLARYGRFLGIAFQIADDLLDVLGSESQTGKSLGTDHVKQKPTLPVIRLLELVTGDEREQVLDLLLAETPDAARELRPWFARYQTIEYSRGAARAFAERAVAELAPLGSCPAVEILRMLPHFSANRAA